MARKNITKKNNLQLASLPLVRPHHFVFCDGNFKSNQMPYCKQLLPILNNHDDMINMRILMIDKTNISCWGSQQIAW